MVIILKTSTKSNDYDEKVMPAELNARISTICSKSYSEVFSADVTVY